MALYVVQAAGTDAAALARARFVRDGFSWPAFLFPPFWLLFRRLWLALGLWVIGEGVFFALLFPHLDGGAALTVGFLAHLAIGCEAKGLSLAKGTRHAAVTGVIAARDQDDAEASFFRRRLAPGPTGPTEPVP